MAETIQPVSISQETRRRYLNYALSVITARALPDVRDGLKPVQRRILFSMFQDLHAHSDARTTKCATIVGHVIGHYHPHGDVAAYDALVRMAQDFVMRERLVHGQGNFGGVDGDPPAHYRYTEAKLTPLSERLMVELRQRTVDLRPNFAATREEPVVLPAQFPNLLVNGTAGIAVGMATNIPPHNLGEVLDACIHLIDEPDATVAQLMKLIKGPDFPLGGKVITDRTTLRKIYEDGQGSIKVQAEWKLESVGRKEQIIVTSIPYGVNKGNLEGVIGEIIASKKLPQLLNLVNESNEKDGLRIALELKADSDPSLVMAYLYKHTALQESFPYNVTCLVPVKEDARPADESSSPRGPTRRLEDSPAGLSKTTPQRLGLKELLRYFLDFRFETVKRRFEFELEQLKKRIHLLEGFKVIFNALDKAIKLIRESDGKPDAAEKLMKAFKLDEEQANAILDVQLYKIAQLEIKRILDELREKKKQAAEIEEILSSKRKLWSVIKGEFKELKEKFGDARRTKIASGAETPEFTEEAYIIRENTNVVLTRDGWIKRVGRLASVDTTRVREGDEVIAVAPGSTLDHVVFFADDGTAYTMRINEVPASSGYGEPLAKFFRLDDQVKIVNAVTTDERFVPLTIEPQGPKRKRRADPEEPPPPYILAVTAQGQVLRTPFLPYRTESTKVGRKYCRLNDGDRVVLAAVLTDETSIYLASREGRVIHFPIDHINILSGVGKGVMGIKLAEDDVCLGGALMSNKNDRMTVQTTADKTIEFSRTKYELTSRGGKGFEAVKRSSLVKVVPPPIALVNWDEIEGKTNGHKAEGNGKKTLFD